jgi:ribonucleoside-diphosphate reductase alpha chain
MTSNRDIPFAKSLIDYIFCWMGCQFIPGYAEDNTPNRGSAAAAGENKNTTTAKTLVEKTKDLTKKIAEAKVLKKESKKSSVPEPNFKLEATESKRRFTDLANRLGALVGASVSHCDGSGGLQTEAKVMEQFNSQFAHFPTDAPACDICGSITVRNGTCYKCFNCGNSMGCS